MHAAATKGYWECLASHRNLPGPYELRNRSTPMPSPWPLCVVPTLKPDSLLPAHSKS